MKIKSYTGKTSVGPLLKINEEVAKADFSKNLYALIRSFGGIHEGSHHPTNKIWDNVNKLYSSITNDPDSTLPFFYARQYLPEGNALINSSIATHHNILEENLKKEDITHKFIASGVFLALSDFIANILSIGNYQSYHLSSDKIKIICTEDSIKIPVSKSRSIKSIPLQSLGLYEHFYFNFKEVEVRSGDYLVFLSSGVYDYLKVDDILTCIKNNQKDEEGAIYEMFSLSNKKGNINNQSGMILRF